MERLEKAHLLSSGSEESNGSDSSSSYGTKPTAPAEGVGSTSGDHGRPTWWKRERLQRNPSLDKVDEDLDPEDNVEQPAKEESKKKKRDGLFGVRSYLHHFYEEHVHKDPTIYEEDDFGYLLGNPKRRRCTSIWWKVFVWIGANFLIFGVIGVLIGYLVPKKATFVDELTDHIFVQDNSAVTFNNNLEICKLVGLILFCIGGLTLAVALLFPSFLYHYCEDDRKDASFKVLLGDEKPATSPLEMQIPSSSVIAGVQPERKVKEAVVTKEGMVPYSD